MGREGLEPSTKRSSGSSPFTEALDPLSLLVCRVYLWGATLPKKRCFDCSSWTPNGHGRAVSISPDPALVADHGESGIFLSSCLAVWQLVTYSKAYGLAAARVAGGGGEPLMISRVSLRLRKTSLDAVAMCSS